MACRTKQAPEIFREKVGMAFSIIMAWLAEPFIEDMPPIGSFWHGQARLKSGLWLILHEVTSPSYLHCEGETSKLFAETL